MHPSTLLLAVIGTLVKLTAVQASVHHDVPHHLTAYLSRRHAEHDRVSRPSPILVNGTTPTATTKTSPVLYRRNGRPEPQRVDSSADSKKDDFSDASGKFLAAVRSNQKNLFKSVAHGVHNDGDTTQTVVLTRSNFGFPISGSKFIQIKSGDGRKATHFNTPQHKGFVSSNDGIAYSGQANVYDLGGFGFDFTVDAKKLNGKYSLSWTDKCLGVDNYADGYAVALTVGSTTTYPIKEYISAYPLGSNGVRTTGTKIRSIDLSKYVGQTVSLDFLVYDYGDHVRDIACAIDDMHVSAPASTPSSRVRARRGLTSADEFRLHQLDCPIGMRACPSSSHGLVKRGIECMDMQELVSCGGCASEGTGKDCTEIPGADGVGCEGDKCVIFSCMDNYKLSADRSECVRM